MEKAREYPALMPTALRIKDYRFFFFSNENSEPEHVHVSSQGKKAKFWLSDSSLADNKGFAQHELGEIARHVSVHRNRLLEKWREHFGA